MKITYEFDTSSEDFDRTELEEIKQAHNMAHALSDICDEFRSWTKYGSFPRKQKVSDEDAIYEVCEGQKEYVKDLNDFIDKHPDVIADIWEMYDRIIAIINENGVDLEKMGY